ncbi:M23 family metallopeptidase [Aestuariibius insulae]|uniref:M23 family metallopeptidase n=1 Tax=Aestuariibius insulae TaxID=2058287 RepID=UPI00345EB72E
MEVDPRFKASRTQSKKRRQRRFAFLGGSAALVLLLFGVGLTIWLRPAPEGPLADSPTAETQPETATTDAPPSETLVQIELDEEDLEVAPTARSINAFVDIPGDPLILTVATTQTGEGKTLAGPGNLPINRVGAPRPDRLRLVSDDLIVTQQQLMTTLPSSREDFAFFTGQAASQPISDGIAVQRDDDLGEFGTTWGTSLESGTDDVTFTKTRIQDTTSTVFLRPDRRRAKTHEDLILRVRVPQSLEDLLVSNGFGDESAAKLQAGSGDLLARLETLDVGSIVAVRFDPKESPRTPLQLSLYSGGTHTGSVTRLGNGEILPATDPWIEEDLTRIEPVGVAAAPADTKIRLLDAFYSAAMRNGIPTTLVGETIAIFSRAHDLDGFANVGDKMTFLYAPDANEGPGQVLFAGIDGPSGSKTCYIVAGSDRGFQCAGRRSTGGARVSGELITPVSGTMTSRFGPRKHPTLGSVRNHNGVDWAAPIGTPVRAALPGTIKSAGVGGSYGNLVILAHANGVETRYAHLDGFAKEVAPGTSVNAGDVIGYVGNTGRSTGPHLHFELRRGGQPVDPLTFQGATVSAAVDALTDQIIRVESAGVATAKNPLSTATGLGQFIESTWLRMMRTYRPELVAAMNRADLLALRTDPSLSREMVTNLARENERYLRSQGHQITAGRLYLAHFLGPKGASRVLGASDNMTILALMGSGVVNANPFLRNYDVADLKAWADRKMRGKGGGSSPPVAAAPVQLTAADRAFIEIIDEIVGRPT